MALKEQAMKNFEGSKKKTMTTISDRGETVSITESAGESTFLLLQKGVLSSKQSYLVYTTLTNKKRKKKRHL